MNLLGANLYDPAVAVTKGAAASVMAAFDTTAGQARIAFVVPPSGMVRVVIKVTLHGAATFSQFLLGALESSTLRGRVVPLMTINGTALATTMCRLKADYIVSGLTPGASVNWDAAWGCETFVTNSLLKYGGANNTSANDAFGALLFQLWDPAPIYTPTSGTAPTATVSARIDTVDDFLDTEIADIRNRLPAALVSGRMDSSVGAMAAGAITAAAHAAGAIDAAALAADAGTEIATAVWASGTRVLTAGTNIALAKGTGLTGFTDLDAAGVRSAVGLAAANLDTQLTTIDDFLDTEVAAIKTKTDFLPSVTAGAAGGLFIAGSNAATTVDITGTLSGSVGSVTGAVGSVTGITSADVGAIKAVTDKLDTAMELDITVYRFTTNALEQSPLGLGGGLDALGVRAALGMATANLDTQLATLATAANLATVAGYLDTEIAAIKGKTDQIAFTGANVNVDLKAVAGTTVSGTGTPGDPWGP